MQKKQLGNTDLHLTAIGLGTWSFGGPGWKYSWGEQDEQQSVETMLRAVQLGVNWFDTAPVYGFGNAEKVVAQALKKMPTKPIVATKCGRAWQPDGTIVPKLTANSIRQEAEDSLRRLELDVIDLYQMHWPQPDEEIESGWEMMATLKEEGKVRCIGVSNFNIQQLERAQKIHPVASLQPPYSMLNRDIENELEPYCKQNNIGLITYSPMQKGILTDKFTRYFVSQIPKDDHRIQLDGNFKEPKLSQNLELVDLLRAIAQKRNCTVAQIAVAWTLRSAEITAAIVGARHPAQIEDTVKAVNIQLKQSDLAVIEMFLAKNRM